MIKVLHVLQKRHEEDPVIGPHLPKPRSEMVRPVVNIVVVPVALEFCLAPGITQLHQRFWFKIRVHHIISSNQGVSMA